MAYAMKNEILNVEGLSVALEKKSMRVDLVKKIDFSLYASDTLALVGESGSGKTTTAHALLGLSGFKTSGKVIFEEKNLLQLPAVELRKLRGTKLSMIFQDPASALNPVFTIGTQIAEVFEIHTACSQEEAYALTAEALEKVSLGAITHPFETYPHQLSGGMKQRAMIAMALALGPKVLIADEPTSALDLTVQGEILDLLKKYSQQNSMAMLLITHDFSVVEKVADRVVVMYLGELVEEASCDELFKKPFHPYTQALMQARPTKENRKKMLKTVEGTPLKASCRPSGCPFHTRCPFVMPKCCSGSVPNFYLTPTHKVRCWLYEEEGKAL
jgi:oligopeptide/dipeptide ABC transporter ATP-binding protein